MYEPIYKIYNNKNGSIADYIDTLNSLLIRD